MLLGQLSAGFQSLPALPTSKLGPSGADSRVGGFVYILGPCGPLQQALGDFSSATATPTGFYCQRFGGFSILHWNPGLCGLSCSPVVPLGLSTCKCGTAPSTSHCQPLCPPAAALSASWSLSHSTPLHNLPPHCVQQSLPCCKSSPPGYPSPPLLLVWMNVSSLAPWLSNFHTV